MPKEGDRMADLQDVILIQGARDLVAAGIRVLEQIEKRLRILREKLGEEKDA